MQSGSGLDGAQCRSAAFLILLALWGKDFHRSEKNTLSIGTNDDGTREKLLKLPKLTATAV